MSPQPLSKYDSGRTAEPVLLRIRSRCVVNSQGCWLWQGATVGGGYGRTKVGSRRDGTRRNALCHVATWEALNGPKPDGMTLDHVVCDTPVCCNPDHLALATLATNIKRSLTSPTAVNARKTCCPRCGGPYSPRPAGGGRHCRPCYLAYLRAYNQRRSGARKLGMR